MLLNVFCKGHPAPPGAYKSLLPGLLLLFYCTGTMAHEKVHPPANSISSGFKKGSHLPRKPETAPISGTILGDDGKPVSGASISVKGTRKGTVSGEDGKFTIDANPGDQLTITSVGFETKEVTVGATNGLNIVLTRIASTFEETVVIGYGTTRKRNMTSAASSVKVSELLDIPTTNLVSALAGKAAGLQAVVRTGAPGAAGGIQIRGTTSISTNVDDAKGLSNPLYVIDGVPTSLEELGGVDVTNIDFLASLNMEDIESIDILKDASAAAIYGSRGANGVIVIKTKKGRSGKTRFNFTSYTGINSKPDPFRIYTGAAERRRKLKILQNAVLSPIDQRNGLEVMSYIVPLLLTDSLNPAFNNNYDYQDLFYRTGKTQSYFMDVSGGPENTNYRISMGYDNEKGIVTATGFERFTLNSSISNIFTKGVRNDLRFRGAYMNRQTGLDSRDPRRTFPVSPLSLNSSLFYQTEAELALLTGQLTDLYNTNRNTELSLYDFLTVDFLKHFQFNAELSGQMWLSRQNLFQPAAIRAIGQSYAAFNRSLNYSLNAQPYLSYRQQFNHHQVSAMAGYAVNFRQAELEYASAENGPNDAVRVIQGFSRDNLNAGSDISISSLISYYGRIGYDYKNRYLLSLNFRREASSRFGKNSRWGNFPAVSAGWVVSDEPFFDGVKNTVNFFKLRGSYGINGNQHNDDYLKYNAYQAIGSVGGLPFNRLSVRGYGGTSAVIPNYNQPANNQLSWEETRQWNIGGDMGLFNDRLTITADAYRKYTDGIIFDAQFPDYSGYSSSKGNFVDIVNMGWELSLEGFIFPRNNKFTWSVQTYLAQNQNYIAQLPNGGRDFINTGQGYAYVSGQPTNLYYMHEYRGVVKDPATVPVNPLNGLPMRIAGDFGLGILWPSGYFYPGMPMFTDVDGDFTITEDTRDMKFIEGKSPNPKIIGGVNTFMKFGNFSLRVMSNFSFGSWIYNYTLQRQIDRYNRAHVWFPGATYTLYEDYSFYDPSKGAESDLPRMEVDYSDAGGVRSFRRSSMYLERGDFWKISDAIVTYTIPTRITKRISASQIQVNAAMTNVWQWQASSVPDATMVNARGEDYGDGYPMGRRYNLGLRFVF